MPIFATLISGFFSWCGATLASVMAYGFTVQWARRAFIVALGAAFFVAVTTFVSALLGAVSAGASGPYAHRFLVGLGMFIPSNAVAVLSSLGSVYLACVVYRLKVTALQF